MKIHLSVFLAVLVAASVLTGCAGQAGTPEQSVASNPSVPASVLEQKKVPDNSFSKEEYQKLLAMQFDDYRHMTIAEFQDRVWRVTDTPEYLELLERFFQSETLYQKKDSDETAWFLFYILEPLTAERWQTRTYSATATSDFHFPAENARLEYTYTLTILAANRLMVKDYNDMRLAVIDAMQNILKNRTQEELRNECAMRAEIQAYVDETLPYLQTPEVSVAIEYAYFPLSAEDEEQENHRVGEHRDPGGTEEDYRTLLALKTPGYENLPLAEFNRALLDWANEDYDRMERINHDTAWNNFPVDLTEEERSFVSFTAFLSGMENGKQIRSSHTGREENPVYDEYLPQKTTATYGAAAWCSLYYQFEYHILDAQAVTVGARDRQIEGMIRAVRTFWDETELEDLLNMSESDLVQQLEKLAAAHSTEHITITTREEQVHFERMDERQAAC